MQRSQTDSNISYDVNEEVQEVPGSVFYILKNGEINYRMVLDGVHSVSRRETTTRTCGVLLNILNCLMDLGIVEKHEKNPEPEVSDKQKKSPMTVLKEIEKKQEKPNAEPEKEKKTAHHIAMESLVRYFYHPRLFEFKNCISDSLYVVPLVMKGFICHFTSGRYTFL